MNKTPRNAVVFEDNAQVRKLINVVLNSLGIENIIEADNGEKAIAALKATPVDIIIMDWKMDVMDGLECTRRIRAGIEGIDASTPILLLTSAEGPEAEASAFAAGVDLFMVKPFSIKSLYGGISKILNVSKGA